MIPGMFTLIKHKTCILFDCLFKNKVNELLFLWYLILCIQTGIWMCISLHFRDLCNCLIIGFSASIYNRPLNQLKQLCVQRLSELDRRNSKWNRSLLLVCFALPLCMQLFHVRNNFSINSSNSDSLLIFLIFIPCSYFFLARVARHAFAPLGFGGGIQSGGASSGAQASSQSYSQNYNQGVGLGGLGGLGGIGGGLSSGGSQSSATSQTSSFSEFF